MSTVKTFLQSACADRNIQTVLEIGSGRGGFLSTLIDSLGEQVAYTGIDPVGNYIDMTKEIFKDLPVTLYQMNGENLDFETDSFDMICISNTLHHLENKTEVIEEMKRVLKPGGTICIQEMVQDQQGPKQESHVWLHHINAEIDQASGVYHDHTYSRAALDAFIREQSLAILAQAEYLPHLENPIEDEQAIIKEALEALSARIQRIDSPQQQSVFQKQLSDAKEQLLQTGFALATECLFLLEPKKSNI